MDAKVLCTNLLSISPKVFTCYCFNCNFFLVRVYILSMDHVLSFHKIEAVAMVRANGIEAAH